MNEDNKSRERSAQRAANAEIQRADLKRELADKDDVRKFAKQTLEKCRTKK